MAIMRWTPSGVLDVATDPTELPQQSDGKNVVSGAMTRCTNLQLDRQGIAQTRKGYHKLNSVALTGTTSFVLENHGQRYEFAGSRIYRDEILIGSGYQNKQWSAVKYNAFNDDTQHVFATNGTERLRMSNEETRPAWDGVETPTTAPTLSAGYDYAYTHDFELSTRLGVNVYYVSRFGTLYDTYTAIYLWEMYQLEGIPDVVEPDPYPTQPMWYFEGEATLTDVFGVVYTWLIKYGTAMSRESNASPAATVTMDGAGMSVLIPASCPDERVTHLRIYRTIGDGSTYYLETDVPLGTTKTVLLARDEELSDAEPPEHDWEEADNGLFNWGIEAPSAAPVVSKSFDYNYTYSWEATEQLVPDEGHISQEPFKMVEDDNGVTYWFTYDHEGALILADPSTYPDTYSTQTTKVFERSVNLSEKYQVSYTLCRKRGDLLLCESNPSPAGEVQNEGGIGVTLPTTLSDPQVTHIRVYRTLGDGADFYFDTEVELGTANLVLTKRDEELGTEAPVNHYRPPINGTFLLGPAYNGILFMSVGNNLYFSSPQQPEYWPALDYVEIGTEQYPIVSMCVLGGVLYVATAIEIYMVQGTGVGTFSALPMGAMTGTQSRLAFCAVHGAGIYHLGTDGVYLFRPGADQRITDQYFRPIMLGETIGGIPGMSTTHIDRCWLHHFKGRLWFGYIAAGGTYPVNVLVLDIVKQRTVHYQYPYPMSCLTTNHDDDCIVTVTTTGDVLQLDYGDTDSGSVIAWQVETKEFGELRKYFPRAARWDVGFDNGASLNGYVMLDGEVKQTHAITSSRQTKRRLITGCNGDRLSLRISGTGPVSIYGAEAE